VGSRSRHGWARRLSHAARYLALAAACAAASLINPYGYHLHMHVAEYLRSDWIRDTIQEFQSPIFRSENMLQFEALMLIGLIAAGLLFRAAASSKDCGSSIWRTCPWAASAMCRFFVTVCAPVIAAEISDWWRGWTGGAKKSSLLAIVNQVSLDLTPSFLRTAPGRFWFIGP